MTEKEQTSRGRRERKIERETARADERERETMRSQREGDESKRELIIERAKYEKELDIECRVQQRTTGAIDDIVDDTVNTGDRDVDGTGVDK